MPGRYLEMEANSAMEKKGKILPFSLSIKAGALGELFLIGSMLLPQLNHHMPIL